MNGKTLASMSTSSEVIRGEITEKKKTEAAELVGQKIAEKCKELSIETVIFDRNGFIYHGRVKAVAEGAREGGLQFWRPCALRQMSLENRTVDSLTCLR